MKLSYNWIKDYCDIDLSVNELAAKLTSVGLVVEEITQIGNDNCLDMEVTANRPDCLGFLGIAKEIRAVTGCNIKTPVVDDCDEINKNDDSKVVVTVQNKELCPRYTARIIENVKIGPSPVWLQERLTTIGLRTVNNVVDITNYVLFETGQPLHAFDFDKLDGNEINVRLANSGEKMVAIDGTNLTLTPEMLVIADKNVPVAVAGVMGGLETEVTENTKTILLECARFAPASVRRTSKKLTLTSDSSYRFERAVDPEGVLQASKRAADMIMKIAGGNFAGGSDIDSETKQDVKVTLRINRINKVLGIEISREQSKKILEGLGFIIVAETDDTIKVSVPGFRSDVTREIDLIEEIIRIYGYDKIPVKTNIGVEIANKKPAEIVTDRVRTRLTGIGLFETVSFSIVEETPVKYDVNVWSAKDNMIIINPLNKAENRLRKTLLFNCLKIMKHNQDRGVKPVDIFEISNIYLPTGNGNLPDEKICLGILVEKDFLELKGIIESILQLQIVKGVLSFECSEFNFFESDKSALINLDGTKLGYIGELNKGVRDTFGLNRSACFAEIDFNLLIDKTTTNDCFEALPNFPGITRDVALVIDENVKWGDIDSCVQSTEIPFFDGIEFFDVFRGKQIEAGKKSLAFSVKFRSEERTLKGEEADEAINTILVKLSKNFDAKIRE